MVTKTIARVFAESFYADENNHNVALFTEKLNQAITDFQEQNACEVISCSKPSIVTFGPKNDSIAIYVTVVFQNSNAKYHQDLLDVTKKAINDRFGIEE